MGRAELSRLVQSAAERRTITMRLQVNESTVASHQATRDVGDGRVHKQSSSLFGSSESQVVTRVTEYFWRHEVAYELIVFTGSDSSARNAMRLSTRTAHAELVTINTAEAPLPLQRRVPPVDAELTLAPAAARCDLGRELPDSIPHPSECEHVPHTPSQ